MKKFQKPRKTAVQARSQATVDVILAAATRILSEDDPETLNTNRIAERAGVSIGSLYQYFPGKDAILSALTHRLIDQKMKGIEINLAVLVESRAPPEILIDRVVEFLVDMKTKNLKFERALTGYMTRNGDFELSKRLDEKVIEKIAKILEPLRGADVTIDPDWSIYLLFHALRGIILATSMQRPSRMKEPGFKREMQKLVKGYLLRGK